MKNFIFKNYNFQKGFTLVEALVSIALIMIAVLGPLTLTFNAINTIRENKNRVIASYLAEEIVEDFRNYRDNFSLACSGLNINYNYTNQQIDSVYCVSDTNNQIPPVYYNFSTPPDTNPQNIAWKMFITKAMGDITTTSRTDLYLDNNNFYFNPQNIQTYTIASDPNCVYLKYDDSSGYNCSQGESTRFKRTVNLTKLPGNVLKIDAKVIYLESGNILQGEKSVSVTSYLYQK